MNAFARLRPLVAVFALAAAAPLAADPALSASSGLTAGSAGAAAEAQEVLRGELRNVLLRMIESGAFADTAPEQIALSLTLPAERYVNLGVLVDSRGAGAEGLPVLGTLPGGAAQRLGLRPGDRLLRANTVDLRGTDAGERFRAEVERLREGGPLELELRRDGQRLTLTETLRPQYLPAVRLELGEGSLLASTAPLAAPSVASAIPAQAGDDACGRISVFHIAPRSQDLYPAKVLEIDGEIPGPANSDTYRVTPGRHTLTVVELIDPQDLPTVYTRARPHKEKTLEIEVRPGTTYLVASRLNREHRNRVIDGRYWDPVVWKEVAEPCR